MLSTHAPCFPRLRKYCKPAEVLEPEEDQGNVPELQSNANDPDALQLPNFRGPYLLCIHAKVLLWKNQTLRWFAVWVKTKVLVSLLIGMHAFKCLCLLVILKLCT